MEDYQTETESRFRLYEELLEKSKVFSEKRMGYLCSGMIGLYLNKEAGDSLSFSYEGTPEQKVIDNSPLGIIPNSLLEYQLVQCGDPWVDSDTNENINKQEREVIEIVGKYLGMKPEEIKGYVASGGTEGNLACLWWSIRHLKQKNSEKINEVKEKMNRATTDYERMEYYIKHSLMQKPVVYFSKNNTHYSVKKSCELLSLDYTEIAANENGEMDLVDFRAEITKHMQLFPYRSIIVNANAGSTIRGAIDNIPVINQILKELTEEQTKTSYTIHADGAYLGIVLPIIKPFGDIANYFTDIGVNTMSICATKFLGLAVSSIVLVKKDFLDVSFDHNSIINYAGKISDTTITGCRSSHNVLIIHNALHSIRLHKDSKFLSKIVENNFNNANYFFDRLVTLLGEENIQWNKYQFNILFKRPSDELVKKYTLMPAGNNMVCATIIQHVNKKKIDEFLEELAKNI